MTISYNSSQIAFHNPYEGFEGAIIFSLTVLLSVGVVITLCSNLIGLDASIKHLITSIYFLIIITGWFSFSVSNGFGDLIGNFFFIGLWWASIFLMLSNGHQAFFWVCLSVTVIFSLFIVSFELGTEYDDYNGWEKFTVWLFTIWVITNLFITLGRTQYFPYAYLLTSIKEIHFFLDIRILATTALLTFLAGRAIFEAFNESSPNIPMLPQLKLPNAGDNWNQAIAAIIQSFVIVINVVLIVMQKITNILWYLVALISVFLYRIGAALANDFVNLFLKNRIWVSILKILFNFLVMLTIARFIQYPVHFIESYLANETSIFLIQTEHIYILIYLISMFIIVLLGIVIFGKIWDYDDNPLPQTAFGGTMLIIAWALSAGIIYLVNILNLLELRGFNSLGIYTLIVISIIGLVFVSQLLKRLLPYFKQLLD